MVNEGELLKVLRDGNISSDQSSYSVLLPFTIRWDIITERLDCVLVRGPVGSVERNEGLAPSSPPSLCLLTSFLQQQSVNQS